MDSPEDREDRLRIVRQPDESAGGAPAHGWFQWRLDTLFLLTAVVAVAMAGWARLGLSGAMGAIVLTSIGLSGLLLVLHAVRWNSARLSAVPGILMVLLAGYGWWAMVKSAPLPIADNMPGRFDRWVDPEFLLALGLAGVVLYGIWHAMRRKPLIVIGMDAQGEFFSHGLSRQQTNKVIEFFTNDSKLPHKASVQIFRQPDGSLRYKFHRLIEPELHQTIRNFMATVM